MSELPKAFLTRPIAHRGFHDKKLGRIENSASAFLAAVKNGYGIELDLQMSSDGEAIVFHDYDLGRVTSTSGAIRQRTSQELAQISLSGGPDRINTFAEVLDLVDGRVPLLIEIKDQSGDLGTNDIGLLEAAAAQALKGYSGDVAVMSFNPHSVASFAKFAPDIPRGLTTDPFLDEDTDWALVPAARRAELRAIPDFDRTGSSFVSHDVRDLDNEAVSALKANGVPVLCWTVKSPEVEAKARKIADNVTFEGYSA